MKLETFWTDQAPRPADLAVASELPTAVDVAIVGSGYTGLNAARVLAKSGAAVAVLERHTIGWGASSRNGGMATPGIKQGFQNILKWYGPEKERQFWQASLDAIDLIDEIVKTENIDCDWKRNGHIALAYKPSHFEHMREHMAWYVDKMGYTHKTLVSRDEIRSEIGTDVYFGGMADDFSGGIQPAKYVFGLAKAVAAYGVNLCEHAEVTAVNRLPNGFELFTSRGAVKAKEVLVATNGYTDNLVRKIKPKIFPIGSYIIVTEPLSAELQQSISPKGRMFYDTKNFLNYFRLTPDGRFLWGGRNNLSPNLDLEESAAMLRKDMAYTFPELAEKPITHTWSGQLGGTFDLMPHIGRVDGIHYAFGYSGHGLSIATYVGTEVGKLLSGAIKSSPFAEIPERTMFFYRNKPWFLPFAALYYRFLDQVS